MKIDIALWDRLLPLLDKALERPPAQRRQWLSELAADSIAKDALLRLLADRERIEEEGFLDALPKLGEAAPCAPALSLQADQVLGAYRLVRELGRGGMSVVWLAERDDGQLRRRVALKFPHAGPDQAALIERLRREREILAALEHRNIARLYDVGTSPEGIPFLVLEYVEGQALVDYCNERQMSVGQRLQLFLQVLRAVQHAHGMLVLHRDIKPSNILVNAAGDVKLLDFGIAKLLSADTSQSSALTRDGGRVLTPDYAAPEQIAGASVSTATDVYALGVLLFELLTGDRPYRLPRCSVAALEEAILSSQPRRPSDACRESAGHEHGGLGQAKLSRALRGDLDLIVLTALQKQPERRYATAEAFEQDIRRHLARLPVLAQPDSRWYRLRKFVARNAVAVGAGSLVILALGIGLGMTTWQARQTRLEAAKATAVKDFLISLFESNSVEQADSLRKRKQSVQELLEESAKSLGSGLAKQPEIRDEMQGVVGRLLHDLNLNAPAVEVRRQRVELQAAHGVDSPAHVAALHDLADSLAQRGDKAAASQALAKAIDLCPAPGLAAAPACLSVRTARGLQLVRENKLANAAADIESSAGVLSKSSPNSVEAAEALAALGELRARQNRSDEAHALLQQAAAIRTSLWGRSSPRLARARYELALNLWADRRHGLAEVELKSAMEAFATSLGPDHPTTALVELQLGRLRSWTRGEGQQEIAHASRIIADGASQLDPEKVFEAQLVKLEHLLSDGRLSEAGELLAQLDASPPGNGDVAHDLAMARAWYCQVTGRFDDARSVLRGVRARLAGDLGGAHPYVANVDLRLASIDLSEDRFDEARAGFERVLQSQGAREVVFGTVKHQATIGLARVAMARGDYEKAWPVISAHFEHAQRTPREEQYATTVNDLNDRMGQVLTGLGRAAQARPHFENVIKTLEKAYRHHPTLAVVRAHFVACLVQLGDIPQARAQLELAQAAIAQERLVGVQYRQAVDRARLRLQAAGR
ncbi:serine/threonine-protein kinase [Piscinibacter sp. XHJ-5]|uniref:serine/threonine-protein kinase n=1 Tax=Piscinibacter sp. XHJ-5 TaxID=3037797 RepID=UPI002452CB01|nr:serine/threonine-protein kinase [Piscinibacter sp. XHJ-5]